MVKKNLASGPVLVTGAAGFIGSHLTRRLMESGYRVVALDDLSGGFRDNLPADADFVEASVLDQDRLTKLFEKHKFRHVYHLAAYAAEGLSHFIRKFNYSNNVLGSMNLINLSVRHGVERFVFTSSIAVYGSNQVPMHERMAPSPEDPYGIAKYAVELDLRAAHELFGLQYTVFRPHNVYGEYQNIGDRYRNVIGIFMNQLALGQPLTIFGDGQQQRAFSYIDDVVWPMVACLDMPETARRVQRRQRRAVHSQRPSRGCHGRHGRQGEDSQPRGAKGSDHRLQRSRQTACGFQGHAEAGAIDGRAEEDGNVGETAETEEDEIIPRA